MPTPKKPTALKVLEGTNRADRANKREPQPRPGAKKPDGMSTEASRKWDELAPTLERLGLLGETDASALEALCETYALWRRNQRSGDFHDQAAASRNLDALLKMLDRFGMNPAARSKVAARLDEPVDPLDQWMKSG